jgi:hypothetical protein
VVTAPGLILSPPTVNRVWLDSSFSHCAYKLSVCYIFHPPCCHSFPWSFLQCLVLIDRIRWLKIGPMRVCACRFAWVACNLIAVLVCTRVVVSLVVVDRCRFLLVASYFVLVWLPLQFYWSSPVD